MPEDTASIDDDLESSKPITPHSCKASLHYHIDDRSSSSFQAPTTPQVARDNHSANRDSAKREKKKTRLVPKAKQPDTAYSGVWQN